MIVLIQDYDYNYEMKHFHTHRQLHNFISHNMHNIQEITISTPKNTIQLDSDSDSEQRAAYIFVYNMESKFVLYREDSSLTDFLLEHMDEIEVLELFDVTIPKS